MFGFKVTGSGYKAVFLLPGHRGSPPTSSTSSSSLTNDVAKQPVSRDLPPGRPGPTGPTGVQYTPHSHQFPRTRKMFDKGPDQVQTLDCWVIFNTNSDEFRCQELCSSDVSRDVGIRSLALPRTLCRMWAPSSPHPQAVAPGLTPV